MENLLVILIVGLAAFFIGRRYYRKYTQKNQCSCGCTSCPTDASTCDLPEANEKLSENQKG
ncbi:MAG: FeoB-associated Cys-rich membrane protein [Desulfobacterales bacterium]